MSALTSWRKVPASAVINTQSVGGLMLEIFLFAIASITLH
jgi:hypothetical protein